MTFLESFKSAVVTLAVLFLVGTLCFFAMSRVKSQADWLVKDTLTGLSYAGELNSSLIESFNRLLLAVNAASPSERDGLLQEMDTFNRHTAEYIDKYEKSIYLDEDRKGFENFLARHRNYQKIKMEVLRLAAENQSAGALALLKSSLLPAFRESTGTAELLFDYNVKAGKLRGQEILLSCRRTQFLFAIIGSVSFASGFAVAIVKFVFSPMFREN